MGFPAVTQIQCNAPDMNDSQHNMVVSFVFSATANRVHVFNAPGTTNYKRQSKGLFSVNTQFLGLSFWYMELIGIKVNFPTRIFYRGVLCLTTDCRRVVWCRGIRTCFLYGRTGFGKMFTKVITCSVKRGTFTGVNVEVFMRALPINTQRLISSQ